MATSKLKTSINLVDPDIVTISYVFPTVRD